MGSMKLLWSGLLVAASIAACGATYSTTPQVQPLPVVTLKLEPSVATVTAASADTLICISAPSDWFLHIAPGSMHTVCQSARGWLSLKGFPR